MCICILEIWWVMLIGFGDVCGMGFCGFVNIKVVVLFCIV